MPRMVEQLFKKQRCACDDHQRGWRVHCTTNSVFKAVFKLHDMSGVTSVNQCSILSTKMPVICSQLRSIHSNPSKYRLKKVGTRGRCALQIRRPPAIINMATTTEAASDDDGVERRRGVFHPNLWDDDFIQSLSTAYHGVMNFNNWIEFISASVWLGFFSLNIGLL